MRFGEKEKKMRNKRGMSVNLKFSSSSGRKRKQNIIMMYWKDASVLYVEDVLMDVADNRELLGD